MNINIIKKIAPYSNTGRKSECSVQYQCKWWGSMRSNLPNKCGSHCEILSLLLDKIQTRPDVLVSIC